MFISDFLIIFMTFAENQRAKCFPSLYGISGKRHHFSRIVHPIIFCAVACIFAYYTQNCKRIYGNGLKLIKKLKNTEL
jgi:hypothetical protein